MKIYQKIEQVREKPEHVRMQYVWGAVAVSMIVVCAIWIFSMKINLKAAKIQVSEENEFSKSWEEIKKQSPSINEIMESGNEPRGQFAEEELVNDVKNGNEMESISSLGNKPKTGAGLDEELKINSLVPKTPVGGR